ncbi:formimidoylglutamase [Mangrovimonas spongiae]|uniref:Arginase n=1 Tax=Mangrovimonas spongiae TaxID=2494697 RepID=A0A3R9NPB8_9FLAO|nr:formimidoylglutamase [Mangrovimonas spongiae]RSK38593.1 arginase [Mangrovimonas spongiae]
MDKLVLFNNSIKKQFLNKRAAETKFGESITTINDVCNIYETLNNLDVSYVIIGLPEDVGVFANHGKPGTRNAFHAAIKVLLNIQDNDYTFAKKVLILGHLDFDTELEKLSKLNSQKKKDIVKARKLTAEIDKHVTQLIYTIVKANKIPIIIGGGHNNAYGNIKGTSLALNKPINVINFDAHTDFRKEEGRHSGNGFTYAFNEGFLNQYFIFGLHENYTSKDIFKALDSNKRINYNSFEAMQVRKELKFKTELKKAQDFICQDNFGIEIDCDAIEGISSSAMSPTGFSVTKARRFVNEFAKNKNAKYIHICEAAPTPKNSGQIGKLITSLITDFIRGQEI